MSEPRLGPVMEYVSPPHGAEHGHRGSLIRTGWTFGADALLTGLTSSAAFLVMIMLAGLIAVMAHASLPSIHEFGLKFLVSSEWRPNTLEIPRKDAAGNVIINSDGETETETLPAAFGALPVIFGTIVSSVVALVFALPLSFGAALFLVRIAPKIM